MKRPTIFISYSHSDSQFVDQFADKLKASGVDIWIDKWEIKVGDSITGKINEGIGKADFLIVVLSRASVNSKWVKEELNTAIIRNVEEEKQAFILPVLLEECEIPSLLKHRRYANFKDDPEQAFQELLEGIQPKKPFEPEMILPPAKGVYVPIPNEIVESVKRGNCILFLGTMASAPSPEGSRFQYKEAPPSGAELSRRLAAICRYSDEDVTNLQRVSLFYQSQPGGSRHSLTRFIAQEITGPEIVPSPVLHMLAALPFPIVITTTYDQLFDIALSRANTIEGRPKQPIIRIYDPDPRAEPEYIPLDIKESEPVLMKLHGSIDKSETIVVTEEDYILFTQKMSTHRQHPIHRNIQARMVTWPLLFIGYNLKDYNLRLLFRMLRWGLAGLPWSYVVDPSPDNLVDQVWHRGAKPMVSLIRENLWDFVPSLYKEIKGVEYQP